MTPPEIAILCLIAAFLGGLAGAALTFASMTFAREDRVESDVLPGLDAEIWLSKRKRPNGRIRRLEELEQLESRERLRRREHRLPEPPEQQSTKTTEKEKA